MTTIEKRMESFVAWYGEIPTTAHRLPEFEALKRAWTSGSLHFGGEGGNAVTAYADGPDLWIYCFERAERGSDHAAGGAERWRVRGANAQGRKWTKSFFYWPANRCWRHVLYFERGENYGRHTP